MKNVRSGLHRHPTPRLGLWLTVLALLLTGVALLSYTLETLDVRPRALARYVEHRASGNSTIVTQAAAWLAGLLDGLDQPLELPPRPRDLRLGAQAGYPLQHGAADAQIVPVASPEDAVQAIQRARPGDQVTFAPGTYRFSGTSIAVNRAGTRAAPIVLRGDSPETVFLEFDMAEGFVVSAPYWIFENMNIRGVCARHADCEHAFHVVSRASHFVARNNTVTDFNAHIKINGEDGSFPDDGLIEGNTLSNRSVSAASRPSCPRQSR